MSATPEIYAAALACLPGMGPATLGRLLGHADPETVWLRVLADLEVRPPGRRGVRTPSWTEAAARVDLTALAVRIHAAAVHVTWTGRSDFPPVLVEDPAPPGVLFWRGDLAALARPCVALVGTRRCTPDGRAVAYELGRDLADAGVCVVSGLALGIDGAAHAGALSVAGRGGTVGVAASGPDRPYPLLHTRLWQEVVDRGAVLSETPPGWPAQAWRFPARNRIIAGLVSLVVVVESHGAGGSLLTAEAALDRGVDVGVVPGPVHSPASVGTNRLLFDGAGPVRSATDILERLALLDGGTGRLIDRVAMRTQRRRADARLHSAGPAAPAFASGPAPVPAGLAAPGPEADPRPALSPAQHRILVSVSRQPTSLGRICERVGWPVGTAAGMLEDLRSGGWVDETVDGRWVRIGPA